MRSDLKSAKELWGWTKTLGISISLAMLVNIFVLQPFKVNGQSMEPTLQNAERIYVSKLSHTFSYLPEYNDIVVVDSRVNRDRTLKDDLLENPLLMFSMGKRDGKTFWVKRVIGRPGDTLEFKNEIMYRNGQPLNEPYIKEKMVNVPDAKIVIPENHVFVMGDNRNNSDDSRVIGVIPLDHIMGKKLF
ncbi:signal peptidase I [Brevibacillus fortis]|uniref:Signal peptidase I n=1 Tax=Brevibacillus fortis TaxID=2126352 RepID=A0A2P7ULM5_9BACL|nr:signal peptidase I [Brevibacillus fortis]PSJ87868.1 signal peptidase I [Brevibacillus fortis]